MNCLRLGMALFLFTAFSGLVAFPGPAAAQGAQCVRKFDTGAVNWSTGRVQVMGKAAPEAGPDGEPVAMPGSARAHAIRNIITILKQIRITPDLTVGQ